MTGVITRRIVDRRPSPINMARPLHIAMVTTFYPPHNFGGDGQYVRRLAHALVRRGHKIEVIHDADAYRLLGGPTPEPLPEPTELTVHRMWSPVPVLSCLATQQVGRPVVHGQRIRKILARGFDVIHFHNISLVGGPTILSYGTGIKLYTAHEHWLVCPMHTLWRHNRELCTAKQCWRCAVAHRRPPQFWRNSNLLAREARHIDAFIALSEFSAKKHAEFGFTEPMVVCPSFIPDLEADEFAQTPPEIKRPYFLFVGRLERIKGIQEVIPAFDDNSPADFLIAGSGGYERHLRELARGRPVHFLGYQTGKHLRALYAGARALIASSLCYEALPLVVLEAFQVGLPVIAPRLGPYPEIVETSRGGLIFQNPDELKAAIHTLATDNVKRDVMGNAAKQAFAERWCEDVGIKAYLGLICKIAEKRKVGGIKE